MTSSGRLVARAALFDELYKIAEAQPESENKTKFKKWLKNTAIVATAAGAGTAATMVVDKFLGNKLGPTWKAMDNRIKMMIVGPALGLSALAPALLLQKRWEEQQKRLHE